MAAAARRRRRRAAGHVLYGLAVMLLFGPGDARSQGVARKSAGEAPAAVAPSARWPRLGIASYNVQFATPDIPLLPRLAREFPGHKPNVAARARAIGKRLACLDIVAFQEIIHDRRRAQLLGELERSGRSCGKPSRLPSGRIFQTLAGPRVPDGPHRLSRLANGGPGFGPLVGQELAVASRWPIIEHNQHVFVAAAGRDALAAKGVLHARIEVAGRPLELYVTHLQAGDEGQVRRAQFEELAAFVRATAAADAPILVLGDFNVRSGPAERAWLGSEYNSLLRALDWAVEAPRRFVDLWLEAHPDAPDLWSWTKPKRARNPKERRIDLMLLAGDGRIWPLAMARDFLAHGVVADGRPIGHLSDHAALIAELAWPLPQAVPEPRQVAELQP
jgi:endonuclease/exonuclease/phosphatase family metal-dependent hydrolase